MDAPRYHPAPHLSAGSGSFLSAAQLTYYFQDFHTSLEYGNSAPQLVFERLVANLNGPVRDSIQKARDEARDEADKAASEKQTLQSLNEKLVAEVAGLNFKVAIIELEHRQQAATLENCVKEKEALQSSVENLTAELVESKSTIWAVNRPAIGTFHTSDIESPKSEKKRSKAITFTRLSLVPPVLALGLTSFHLANDPYLYAAVFSDAAEIRKDGFDISITSSRVVENPGYSFRGDLHSAGFSWLELDPDDPDFQCGRFDINDHHRWNKAQDKTKSFITFPRAYSKPPRVVVWLNSFVLEHSSPWNLHTYASDVTTTNFLLHINTWNGASVFMANVTWVACSADRKNVWSGSFCTPGPDPGNSPSTNSGYVEFGSGVFSTPPRVIMGISRFQPDTGEDLRLAVKASNITASGMAWGFDSFEGANIYSTGASYIALG